MFPEQSPPHGSTSCESPDFAKKLPRVSLGRYLLQLLSAFEFYVVGILFTLRFGVRTLVGCHSVTLEDGRKEISRVLDAYFDRNEQRGVLDLDLSELNQLHGVKGTVWAANHPGLFDALLMLSKFPDLTCIMRAGLMKHPSMQGGARMCGFIPNDAGPDFMRQAIRTLKERGNLLVFPEGTRTDPGKLLNPFKRGFALAAIKAQAPIQTIVIHQKGALLTKTSTPFQPSPTPVTIRIYPGKVFLPQAGDTVDLLTERIESYFTEELKKLHEVYGSE